MGAAWHVACSSWATLGTQPLGRDFVLAPGSPTAKQPAQPGLCCHAGTSLGGDSPGPAGPRVRQAAARSRAALLWQEKERPEAHGERGLARSGGPDPRPAAAGGSPQLCRGSEPLEPASLCCQLGSMCASPGASQAPGAPGQSHPRGRAAPAGARGWLACPTAPPPPTRLCPTGRTGHLTHGCSSPIAPWPSRGGVGRSEKPSRALTRLARVLPGTTLCLPGRVAQSRPPPPPRLEGASRQHSELPPAASGEKVPLGKTGRCPQGPLTSTSPLATPSPHGCPRIPQGSGCWERPGSPGLGWHHPLMGPWDAASQAPGWDPGRPVSAQFRLAGAAGGIPPSASDPQFWALLDELGLWGGLVPSSSAALNNYPRPSASLFPAWRAATALPMPLDPCYALSTWRLGTAGGLHGDAHSPLPRANLGHGGTRRGAQNVWRWPWVRMGGGVFATRGA
ncbi:hypothetical protein KIL84_012810 [Mauremys mutica]|uniref:Uncharacterized protein n=1 Tax=Mauremys mutica TaxID=74926 RepID=A0A9D3XNT1_9SAUR|nr:hypothetical protein KIL84_012810 [Mauremys mutica]